MKHALKAKFKMNMAEENHNLCAPITQIYKKAHCYLKFDEDTPKRIYALKQLFLASKSIKTVLFPTHDVK